MTLLPSEDWGVGKVEGDTYKVGPYCDAPGCRRPVDHKHHLWRRSFFGKGGKDVWWVRVPLIAAPLFKIIRNVVGLCHHHHDDVTGMVGGHKAWIRWDPNTGKLMWLEKAHPSEERWVQVGWIDLPETPEGAQAEKATGERCPTCGRRHRTDESHQQPQPKRDTKTWTVNVPADSENGAEILNTLIEECAEVFGHEHYKSRLRRYYTVVQALTLILQNKEAIVAEVDAT